MRAAAAKCAFALLLVVSGCERLGCAAESAGRVAELIETQGSVERDYAAKVGTWEQAAVGAGFSRGDGLRTGAGSSALVRVGSRGRARVESETTIRFLAAGEPQAGAGPTTTAAAPAGLDVERGQAVIEVGDADLQLETLGGRALLRKGAQVVLQPSESGTRYRVLVGGASFMQADGKKVDVAAGQSISVGIGLAVLDPITPKVAEAARKVQTERVVAERVVDAGAATGAKDAGSAPAAQPEQAATVAVTALAARQEAGGAEARGEARNESVDLSVSAGESFRVYDPRPPTTLAFQVGSRCPGEAELHIAGKPVARGTGELRVQLKPATHAFAVRCVGAGGSVGEKPVARGFARVLRGGGTRTLPKSAPRNSVDLDGRRYTLMYQNLRPIVTVAWPNPPKASAYVLSLRTPDGNTKTFRSKEPLYVVQSKMLADGLHAISMATEGKPVQRTKETSVEIVFDNAAPTESLELPPAAGFAPGPSTRVVGVARAGSRVSVDGRPLSLDEAQRFAQTVPLAPGQRTLVLRFQHPDGGIRYYLRRASGAR